MSRFSSLCAIVFALVCSISSAQAATISNVATGNSINPFGVPDTQTYGEVFTATQTGILTSFSLSLNDGVGVLFGGVGDWNGAATYGEGYGPTTILYTSAPVASVGAQTYTFSPNIAVTAGTQYVIFLSVSGLADAVGTTTMPNGTNIAGLNYFVWNNGPLTTGAWNYFDYLGDALTTIEISAVPLPAALPLFSVALGGLGLAGYRRKKSA